MRSGKAITAMGLAALVGTTSCVPTPPARIGRPARPSDPRALLHELALDPSAAGGLDKPLAGTAMATARAAPRFRGVARSEADADRALQCLTAAVYYEARSETVDGRRAVAQVVLNRVRDRAFPASVCGVVYQGSERSTGCQFSFTCNGSLLRPREPVAWAAAEEIARAALAGSVYAPVGGATFYHADTVMPWWAASMTRITVVGAHLFYRWRGAMERALAFHQAYARVEPAPPPSRAQTAGAAATRYPLAGGAAVTVHRGPVAAPPVADPTPVLIVAAGVRVHRGAAPDLSAPSPDAARIGEEDGAI